MEANRASATTFDVTTWLRKVRDQMAEETKDFSSEAWAAYVHERCRAYEVSAEVQSIRGGYEGLTSEERRARLGKRLENVRMRTNNKRPTKPFDAVAVVRKIRDQMAKETNQPDPEE